MTSQWRDWVLPLTTLIVNSDAQRPDGTHVIEAAPALAEIERLKAEVEFHRCRPCDAVQDANKALNIELARLTKLLDEAREVINFYGDKNNWLRDEKGWRHDMITNDLDDESLNDWEGRFSGKRARAFIAKMDKR